MAGKIEVQSNTQLSKSFLMEEIKNCNLFLQKDDRNFHVWNHRLTIFYMIKNIFHDDFANFLISELEFTISMVKNNLSNFSAWHYRSKLIPIYFNLNKLSWSTESAFEYFKTDLEAKLNSI